MLRLSVLALLLSASLAFAQPFTGSQQNGQGIPRTASMSVNLAGSGPTIPANFVGLSSETGDFVSGFYQGSSGSWTSNGFTGNAASYVNLIKLLGSSGVFRIGGGSSDVGTAPTVTAGMAANFNTFLAALGASWTAIYGLDFVANDTTTAATTASNLASAVGVGNITFQFGNEPSINGFNAAAYTTRWNAYYSAVTGSVPSAHVAAVDDIMNVGWGLVPTVVAGLTPGISGMSFISQHWYSFCNLGEWPTPVPGVLLSSVIQNQYGLGVLSGANQGAGYLSNNGKYGSVLQRMSETNSICARGEAGMSDRMMAATWFVNTAMILASNGWAGMNIHTVWTGGIGVYNPVVIQPDGNFSPGTVFYGMYLFSKVEGQQVVPTTVGGNGNVQAMATKGGNGNANIIVANNDPSNPVSVTPSQSSAWTTATVLQIKGNAGCYEPSPTIGGQSIGEGGAWSGATYSIANGFAISLGPCEAALISIQP